MPVKELRRSIKDRKLFGVCGGLGEYFGLDSTIVRIVYIFLVLASFGWALLLYIILGLVMPEEKPVTTST
ncbi:MAG: PspC domain-containing protein [Ignavibacteriae bacterium]|nr:PspC domain-containing protein [Ignavibacteria bacterium]MBI3364263.1 PspC domain-containing protein [Ignavibacteriota bacterium]